MTDTGQNAMMENGAMVVRGRGQAARPVIGMLVTYLSDPYTQALIQGVVNGVAAHDANLIIYQLDNLDSGDAEFDAYALVDPAMLSGVILTPGLGYRGDRAQERLDAFLRRCDAIPVHSVSLALEGVHSISADSYAGMRSAVEHLLDHHGFRHIAFVTGPTSSMEADARYRGYVDGVQSHGLSLNPGLVVEGDFTAAGGARAAIELLDRDVEIEAIVCASDDTAAGVFRILQLRHIRVPEDLAVVGFDDIEMAKTLSPPLTTVRQPVHEIGRRAAEDLLAAILEQDVPPASVVPTDLVVRRSCGCLPSHIQELVLTGQLTPQSLITYDERRPDIVAALQEVAGETQDLGAIVDALWRDLEDSESSEFVRLVSEQLHQVATDGTDFLIWHAVLSKLRQMIVPLLGERRLWYRAEDLLQQVRSLVDEARLQALSRRQMLLDRRQLAIQEFNAQSASVMGSEDIVALISRSLPVLQVRRCYLSVAQPDSFSDAQLTVSYRDGSGQSNPEGESFAISNLVPAGVWATFTERFTVLALPLLVGDRALGIALFEGDLESLDVYRWLRQSLSGGIFRSQLADAQRAARREAEQASAHAELALRDALVVQRQYVEGAWQSYGATVSGYRWEPDGGAPTRDAWLPVMTDAVGESQLVLAHDEAGKQTLGLPLKLLDEEVIGALGFAREDGEPWTSDQLVRVVTVVNELAQVLETRRLVSDVERRASRLAAAAEVSSAASSITEVDQLLTTSVNLIKDRFALTYAGIFLVDDSREWAALVAGTGEAGRLMLARGHRLEVDGQSMIGACIANATARVTADTASEDLWRPNPLLPNTRSELALPLISRAEVIGAMTIQNEHPGAFLQDDITTLQTMADQLANAIQNARLMERMEQNLREVKMVTGRFTESAWREFVQGRRGVLGYRHQLLGTSPAADRRPEADEALLRGESVLVPLVTGDEQENGHDACAGLGVPIRLRNQILGVLNLRFEDEYVPQETIQLVEQVADRLAVSLETARLLEETQETGQRERVTREITDRMHATLDWDDLMQTAVQDIGQAVQASRAFVQWMPPQQPVPPQQPASTQEVTDVQQADQSVTETPDEAEA